MPPASAAAAKRSRPSEDDGSSGRVSRSQPQHRGTNISSNGRRKDPVQVAAKGTSEQNPSLKRPHVEPTDLEDTLASWSPTDNLDGPFPPGDPLNDILRPRKRNKNSDDPMSTWKGAYIGEFLTELVCHKALQSSKCSTCSDELDAACPAVRCKDCTGGSVHCTSCLLSQHSHLPLHHIQQWTGSFWFKTTLSDLGLIYQLGHNGDSCVVPQKPIRIVVIDTNGVHEINVALCGCPLGITNQSEKRTQLLRNQWYPATVVNPRSCATFRVLELFRLLNVVGTITAHDFVRSLERKTDATMVCEVPDRYKAFGRMARQFAFLLRLKRSGRTHDPQGISATAPGETAVICWACPQDGKNLPPDWRTVAPEHRFLYMLILSVDASFRLKNRMRANEKVDESLGPGFAYFVDDKKYKDHLKDFVTEDDVSTCIAFAALKNRDTKLSTGLRVTGVGGVLCARHEVLRTIGDLQKGERYYNMDYLVFLCLFIAALLWYLVSYDIACQWRKNVRKRVNNLPEELKVELAPSSVPLDGDLANTIYLGAALPVWHGNVHELDCKTKQSLKYQKGVGVTDGECCERFWSKLNGSATSTKEMGPGNRHDTLDDRIGHLNFEKNINLGNSLYRKLKIAQEELVVQTEFFNEDSARLAPDVWQQWMDLFTAWEEDKSQPSPFHPGKKSESYKVTEAEVRVQLRKDELATVASGESVRRPTTAVDFLTAGLQLEDLQLRISAEAAEDDTLTSNQLDRHLEHQITFFKKLHELRDQQLIYSPASLEAARREDDARDQNMPPPSAQAVNLWLPSQLSEEQRAHGCAPGVAEMEASLREAQCDDALDNLRRRLHARIYLISQRNRNTTGQVKSTQARTQIEALSSRVNLAATKYRQARSALVALRGEDISKEFPPLLDKDIRGETDVDLHDEKARRNYSRQTSNDGPCTQSDKSAHLKKNKGNGSKSNVISSWIWTARGGPGKDSPALHASVRVEWSKALARKLRWQEEVSLLKEEMRRVLRYLKWKAEWWAQRDNEGTGVSPGYIPGFKEGLKAYSCRQAAICLSLRASLQGLWDKGISFAGPVPIDNEDFE